MKALNILNRLLGLLGIGGLLFCAVVAFCGYQFSQFSVGVVFCGYATTFIFYCSLIWKKPKKTKKIKSDSSIIFHMSGGLDFTWHPEQGETLNIDFSQVKNIDIQNHIYEVDSDE